MQNHREKSSLDITIAVPCYSALPSAVQECLEHIDQAYSGIRGPGHLFKGRKNSPVLFVKFLENFLLGPKQHSDKFSPQGLIFILAEYEDDKNIFMLKKQLEEYRARYDDRAIQDLPVTVICLSSGSYEPRLDPWQDALERKTFGNDVSIEFHVLSLVQKEELKNCFMKLINRAGQYYAKSESKISGKQPVEIDLTPEPPPFDLSKAKKAVLDKLKIYVKRVESHHKTGSKEIDFAHGFWFLQRSRALNREANYRLAKELINKISSADSCEAFSQVVRSIPEIRLGILENENSDYVIRKQSDFVERGINSKELNDVILEAQRWASLNNTAPEICDSPSLKPL